MAVVLVVSVAGCGVGDGDDAVSNERELARQLLAGWPAPAEMYEVRDLECVKLDDRVQATVTVVNANDFGWAFGVETVFYTKDGEAVASTTDPGYWKPGQAVELSDWTNPLEDFDDPPRCEVNIYHGVDLAFRSFDDRPLTYERLGWDPDIGQRIDGS